MRIVCDIPHSQGFDNGCVVTIGNFDGVHLGHQMVIRNLLKQSQKLGLPAVIVLFEPHPLEYFNRDDAPARLTSLREKISQFGMWSVDLVMVLRFGKQLADLEPEDFVIRYLVEGLKVRWLLVGDDFRFGRRRRGDFKLLQSLGAEYGFVADDSETLLHNGQRISSTAIRHALKAGDFDSAKNLLGRAYSVCGRVIYGDGRGRQLGFPTANIQLRRIKTALRGVFAITAVGVSRKPVPGVANLGVRPTVDGGQHVSLEAHLFDFDQDLYGQQVEIIFHQRIREERAFASLDELTLQIEKDVAQARQLLAV